MGRDILSLPSLLEKIFTLTHKNLTAMKKVLFDKYNSLKAEFIKAKNHHHHHICRNWYW